MATDNQELHAFLGRGGTKVHLIRDGRPACGERAYPLGTRRTPTLRYTSSPITCLRCLRRLAQTRRRPVPTPILAGEQQLDNGEILIAGMPHGYVYTPQPSGTYHVRPAYRLGTRGSPLYCGILEACRSWLRELLSLPHAERSKHRKDALRNFTCHCHVVIP